MTSRDTVTGVIDVSVPEDTPRVADLTEGDLLARVLPRLPRGDATLLGPGDDSAVVTAADGRFVVSTDVLVQDRHFRLGWSTGRDVGRRAAAQNLADVAAMGARPTALVVSLVLPGELPVDWVLGLADGLADRCAPLGAGVVGGDLSGGDLVVVAVTVHGDLSGRAPVRRDGARPGDVVALAGTVGRSAAGFALLAAGAARTGPAPDPAEPPSWLTALVAAHLAPDPPLLAGPAAAEAGAHAMLDVSDGLLRDAGRLAAASGVVLDLAPPDEALAVDLAAVAPAAELLGVGPRDWVLTGGEDHGLLATFPDGTTLPAGFRAIGRVRGVDPADPVASAPTVLVGGARWTGPSGWDHFRP